MSRTIPGTIDVEGREFFYVEIHDGEGFDELLDEALATCPAVPLPKAGGVIEEKARILLGSGVPLLAISYKGDLPGWRNKLESYCKFKGRKWGIASHRKLALSDGTVLEFSECEIIFEN